MHVQADLNQPFPHFPDSPCRAPGWRAQFACPQGAVGRFVGRLMAFKNAPMNRFAVEMLKVQPDDCALEIGFGHGHAVAMIAQRTPAGTVAGIDISDVMVRQAARRNQAAIKAGRVELQQGSVANLPYEYGRFSKVLAVNNYQFWPNQELCLNEVRRVMHPGGLLVLCLRMAARPGTLALAPGFTDEQVAEAMGLVRWVGFHNVRAERRKLGRYVTCVLANR